MWGCEVMRALHYDSAVVIDHAWICCIGEVWVLTCVFIGFRVWGVLIMVLSSERAAVGGLCVGQEVLHMAVDNWVVS